MTIDNLLVFHCAPTLAGLKIASLVCVSASGGSRAFYRMVESYNNRFNSQGLYFVELGTCKERHLLYVYRKDRVRDYLQEHSTISFLSAFGYKKEDTIETHINKLQARLAQSEGFPHELGIFLGYPLEDVKAFIQYKGNRAKLCGEWKVYTDIDFAKKQFTKFKVCRQRYVDMFNRGFSVEKLIIA